ncbi:MAG: hypothetical protein E5Y58_01530 [Mesorhizobium sp.]|nr:MAG: hypothetical protein E5Y58_01530 [Mesorhizobium sp.]
MTGPCPLTLFRDDAAIQRGVPAAGLLFCWTTFLGVAAFQSVVAVLSIFLRERLTQSIERHPQCPLWWSGRDDAHVNLNARS